MAAAAREHLELTAPQAGPGLLRSIAGNAASLTGGRLALALLRFGAALVIVQRAGLERFGEFALVLSFILIAEWLSDFGLADVAVRQIAGNPQGARATMGAFVASKAVQGVAGAAILWGALALMGYPEHVVRSGLIAAAAVILYAGVQVYRVGFRTRMQMGRDVGAEVVSALFLLGAVWMVTGGEASLEALTACYVASRALNLAAAALFARALPGADFGAGFGEELRVLAAASVPLGLAGLVVCAYDAMDAIVLSRLSTSAEVGVFSVSIRIVMLAVIAEQALATAVFPILARQWARDRAAFRRTLQAVLDWGMVAGGALFCALHAGALGLATLATRDAQAVATVLQLLSWAVLARVVVTLIGPMVVIAGRMHYAVWIQGVIASAKWLALMALAPQGAFGAAIAYLVAEIGVGLLPAIYFCQRATGIWLDWTVTLKVVAASAAVAAATWALGTPASLLQGALAVAAFLAIAWALGALRIGHLKQLYVSIAHRHDPAG